MGKDPVDLWLCIMMAKAMVYAGVSASDSINVAMGKLTAVIITGLLPCGGLASKAELDTVRYLLAHLKNGGSLNPAFD